MPSLKLRIAADTSNALEGKPFRQIPPGGANINLFAAGVTKTDAIGLKLDNTAILEKDDGFVNIEASADVIDTDRDQLLFNELVGEGELVMPATVTTEMQVLLVIEYLE